MPPQAASLLIGLQFIPCDVISLILQAVGGALASAAASDNDSSDLSSLGNNIMMAGLAFQVVILAVFMAVSLDFGLRVWRRYRAVGVAAFSNEDPRLTELRSSRRLRVFLAALVLSTVLVFWRSIFRVAELSGGWNGPLMKREDLFIGFEGVLIVIACLALNVGHPVLCMGELFNSAGAKKKQRKAEKMAGDDSESA